MKNNQKPDIDIPDYLGIQFHVRTYMHRPMMPLIDRENKILKSEKKNTHKKTYTHTSQMPDLYSITNQNWLL